jgi:hypothetical protein
MRRLGRRAHPPQSELGKIPIEQEWRLSGTGRACRSSARSRYGADGLACGVVALPVANYTRTHRTRFLCGAGVIGAGAKAPGCAETTPTPSITACSRSRPTSSGPTCHDARVCVDEVIVQKCNVSR